MDFPHFPFEHPRENQEDFINFVSESVARKQSVALEAATGFGKTVCVLTSLLPLADRLEKKIVYCCRTHTQMDRVISELKHIRQKKKVSGVSLRGRREMCLHNVVLNQTSDAAGAMYVCRLLRKLDRCDFYKAYKENQDRILQMEIALSQNPLFSHEILAASREGGFCPYEFSKEIVKDVDVVACSYLYLFHPQIREGFLEGLGCTLDDILLVLDEAHNLENLAQELGSDRLSLLSVKAATNEALEYGEPEIANFCEVLSRIMLEIEEKYGIKEEVLLSYKELMNRFFQEEVTFLSNVAQAECNEMLISDFLGFMQKRGEEIQKDRLKKNRPPRSHIFSVASFLQTWMGVKERTDYCYVASKYMTRKGTETLRLEIVSLDPRTVTLSVLDNVHASVSMSGTLTPLDAYRDVVGLKNAALRVFPSPFRKSHIFVAAVKGVTTKGDMRNPEMYRRISVRISEVVENTPKNVGVFCPSYNVLEGLLSAGLEQIIDKPLFIERKGYSSHQNDELVRLFKNGSHNEGGVLLGVMGGRNAEGEDYPGDEMNSVVLVGVPYAVPTARTNAQIEYYSQVFPQKGRYYGYYLPAHRKLNQGAGRAHRLLGDRAAIVFLDHRTTLPFVKRDISSWIREEMRIFEDRDEVLGKFLGGFFQTANNEK